MGVSGQRGERADQMSKPLGVSSCQLTYLDLHGMLAPKTVCLILLLEQILERAVKLLVTYKNRKHHPRDGDKMDIHTQLQGLGLLLTVLFSIPPPSEEIRMDEYLQTVQ